MCSLGIEPTTFALLTQCSTTEPQEHIKLGLHQTKWPINDYNQFGEVVTCNYKMYVILISYST